jgi:phage terminase large subunit-like protein
MDGGVVTVVTVCEPRFATVKRGRSPHAREVAAVAKALGLGLLPWQRQVLGVALERHNGRPRYRDVLVSVPRQSGKSSLALSLIVWRLLSEPDMRVLYAAQTRGAAREKLLSSWWPRLARSPYAGRLKLFRGFGAETVKVDNGSTLQLLSATESSGHGETTDLVVADESWVHQDARIEQAVRPTMATRRDAQLWAMSTAGTSRSVWWRKKVESGRAAVEMGVDSGLALFEWSAPDGSNLADEDVWWRTMPALGRLIDVETVRADMSNMDLVEFGRAYLNLWPDPDGEGWKVFDEDKWRRAREDV